MHRGNPDVPVSTGLKFWLEARELAITEEKELSVPVSTEFKGWVRSQCAYQTKVQYLERSQSAYQMRRRTVACGCFTPERVYHRQLTPGSRVLAGLPKRGFPHTDDLVIDR